MRYFKRQEASVQGFERWTGVRTAPGSGLVGARLSGRRLWRNRSRTILIGAAVAITLVPVLWILEEIFRRGGSAMSWEFITSSTPFSVMKSGGGFLNGLVGTGMMVGLAAAISIPLGTMAAVYLVEYGKNNWLAKVIRFFSDVMTGVPSIFVGIFIYTILVKPEQFTYSALAGAAALAIIMMPIIVRSSEEMLKLVPNELRDASYALGAAKWQTVIKVVLPAAAPGMTTGISLAIARAGGETAPLIVTILGTLHLSTSLFGPNTALPLLIYTQAGQAAEAAQARAWAGALELLAIVLVFTIVARVMSSRSRISQ